MRHAGRFLLGLGVGAAALGVYLWLVGPGTVLGRVAGVPTWAVLAVLALVVVEFLVDGLGVWASVRPLDGGLGPAESVTFAVAGDFFDVLSPAGPASSEVVMAEFFARATGTDYSEALGVRSVAKYVKSGAQLFLSTALVAVLLVGGAPPRTVVVALGGAALVVVVVGAALVRWRGPVSGVLVAVLGPVVAAVPVAGPGDRAGGREAVAAATAAFWERALYFRSAPGLVALIAVSAVLEQVLLAGAIWVALVATTSGSLVPILPVVAVVPLPKAATVVPVPGSVGPYDALLGGALVAMAGVPAAGAAAAVLVVRTSALGLSLSAGGLATGLLGAHRARPG